jgi:hypothetical protein
MVMVTFRQKLRAKIMDELTCVVCGNPATQKYETIRSDVDPIYADVCDECAVKHTWQCIDLHLQIADYERDWPNYCRKCGGWGGFAIPQTYWEPGDFDVCECICSGFCPRCNHLHNEDWEGEICEECGWQYDASGAGIVEVECECIDQETFEGKPDCQECEGYGMITRYVD